MRKRIIWIAVCLVLTLAMSAIGGMAMAEQANTELKPKAPSPYIDISGSRVTTTDGQISFWVTSDNPDEAGVSYQVAMVSEDGGYTYVLGDYPCDGTIQTVALAGRYLREGMAYRLKVTAYGDGYESQTEISTLKIYVTGERVDHFETAWNGASQPALRRVTLK